MNEGPIKMLKYGIFAAAAGAAAYFGLPILAAMALNLVTVAACAGALFVGVTLLPLLSEVLATAVYRGTTMLIQLDPVAKLRRNLDKHSKLIDEMQEGIINADSQVGGLKQMIRDQSNTLTQEQQDVWVERVNSLIAAGQQMVQMRDEEIQKHEDMKRSVDRFESEYKIGKAFKSALGSMKKMGQHDNSAESTKIAYARITDELNSSQSRLQAELSRRTATSKALASIQQKALPREAPIFLSPVTVTTNIQQPEAIQVDKKRA